MSAEEFSINDPSFVALKRKEWGLSSDPETAFSQTGQALLADLKEADLSSGRHDSLLLGFVAENTVDLYVRAEAFNKVFSSVFEPKTGNSIDQSRAGQLLTTALSLYQQKNTPEEIKQTIYNAFSKDTLERLKLACIKDRWDCKNENRALAAYTKFQNLEKHQGEKEALKTKTRIAHGMIFGRVFDGFAKKAAAIPSSTQESRGWSIVLRALGEELLQTTVQDAYLKTSDKLKFHPVVSTDYRGPMIAMNGPDRQNGVLISPVERLAEHARKTGYLHDGRQLSIFGKVADVDNRQRITVIPGIADVGENILIATGHAYAIKLRELRKKLGNYDKPERGDKLRKIQISHTGGVVLSFSGDGTEQALKAAQVYQMITKAPIINVVHHNGESIGMESDEVSFGRMHEVGQADGIAGIEIASTDMDAMWLATEWAAEKAEQDGGATNIVIKTPRLAAHSDAHGDSKTAALERELYEILTQEADNTGTIDMKDQILQFRDNDLIKMSSDDDQLLLRERVQRFLEKEIVSFNTGLRIMDLLRRINDPMQMALTEMLNQGIITQGQLDLFEASSNKICEKAYSEMLLLPTPKPDEAMEHIRFETPYIDSPISKELVDWKGAEAMRNAVYSITKEGKVLVLGVDVIKGEDVDMMAYRRHASYEEIFSVAGGYWTELKGLFPLVGNMPGTLMNCPIDEQSTTSFALGIAMTPTDPESLAENFAVLIDHGYVDYARLATAALSIHGPRSYATKGRIAHRVVFVAFEGPTPGGGTSHSEVSTGLFNQTPCDVQVVSDPNTLRQVIKYNALHNLNSSVVLVEKGMMTTKPKPYEQGPDYFPPGNARVVKLHEHPADAQVISYGSGMKIAIDAANKYEAENAGKSIDLLDLVSIRPLPTSDLIRFLGNSNGPIVLVTSERKQQSFALVLKALLEEPGSEFAKVIKGREIHIIAAEDVPAYPSDGNLLKRVVPNPEQVIFKLATAEEHYS